MNPDHINTPSNTPVDTSVLVSALLCETGVSLCRADRLSLNDQILVVIAGHAGGVRVQKITALRIIGEYVEISSGGHLLVSTLAGNTFQVVTRRGN